MIRISCTNCKTILSIDDAFAGGVCRCQHCGTIQTVPSQARNTAQVGAGTSKSLYQTDARSGSGLDELAGIVSSGLTSTRLTRSGNSTGSNKFMLPIIVASTIIVALLLAIIVILISRGSSSSTTAPNPTAISSNGSRTPVIAPNTPSFCGTVLDGNAVIYVLDCGASSGSYLGELKDATIKSVESLGPDRKFEILFWNNGTKTNNNYPENTTTYASKDNITAAHSAIDDVAPYGQTDITSAMQAAIAQHPDAIIVATGKGWDLQSKWLDDVMAIRGSSPVKIHTFNLGTSGESGPLKRLATNTGGTYHELSPVDLKAFGQ